MSRFVVTGANGNVGAQALEALDAGGHEVTPVTHHEDEDVDSVVHDVTDPTGLAETFAGHDAVVHLAANPSPEAEWDEIAGPNVDGTYNVYEAAREAGVDRVVFASSNHAVQMYNVADPDDVESMTTDPARPVTADDPPRPDSYYGVSKVAGEAMGTLYADRYGVDCVNLRIGWLLDEDELRETQDGPDSHARFARAMWLSPRDCRAAIRAAATAPLPEPAVTAHAVSANDERYLSLTGAMQALGYRPRDNSAAALDGGRSD